MSDHLRQAWGYLVLSRGLAPTTAALTAEDYEGTTGDRSHCTRTELGTIPTHAVANLGGVMHEVPGEHRHRHGQEWEDFKADIDANGIKSPIFITVDHNQPPQISEGNHRRDAAVELGHSHVPVEIKYFGHAERQGTVLERSQSHKTAGGIYDEPNAFDHPRWSAPGAPDPTKVDRQQRASVAWIREHTTPEESGENEYGRSTTPGHSSWEDSDRYIERNHAKPYPGHWQPFLESIKAHGVKRPVVLYHDLDRHNDKVTVANGHHRVWGAHKMGRKDVPVTIRHSHWDTNGDDDE